MMSSIGERAAGDAQSVPVCSARSPSAFSGCLSRNRGEVRRAVSLPFPPAQGYVQTLEYVIGRRLQALQRVHRNLRHDLVVRTSQTKPFDLTLEAFAKHSFQHSLALEAFAKHSFQHSLIE